MSPRLRISAAPATVEAPIARGVPVHGWGGASLAGSALGTGSGTTGAVGATGEGDAAAATDVGDAGTATGAGDGAGAGDAADATGAGDAAGATGVIGASFSSGVGWRMAVRAASASARTPAERSRARADSSAPAARLT